MDLKIFERLLGCICYFYIIHSTIYILAPLTMLAIRSKHNGGTMMGVNKALDPVLIKEYNEQFELIVVEIMIRNDYIIYNRVMYEFHYEGIVFQVFGDVSQKSACYMSLLA